MEENASYPARVIGAVKEKLETRDRIRRPEVIRIAMKVYGTTEMCWGIPSTTDTALRVMQNEGLIHRVGRGVYEKGGAV